nr:MAG TPA: hypothetical protein [Bacteriophage sp.]
MYSKKELKRNVCEDVPFIKGKGLELIYILLNDYKFIVLNFKVFSNLL